MRPRHWWIAGIVIFILLAPVEASSMIHSAALFIQTLLSSFHLH